MAWIGAAIGGAAALSGDILSQQGASSTNAAQIAADMEMQQRAFSFDKSQQLQSEQYATQMSNTQMQRRVADLKAAGLNPALAYIQGGASSPQVGAVSGPGGSVGSLQNPNAAFGNLGGQVSSAVGVGQQGEQIGINAAQQKSLANVQSAQAVNQLADAAMKSGAMTDNLRSQIQDNLADAAMKGRQAGDIADSEVIRNRAQAEASLSQAQLNSAQQQVALAQVPKIQADIALISQQTTLAGLNAVGQRIQNDISGLNEQQIKMINPYLLETAKANAQIATNNVPETKAQAGFWNSWGGAISPYVHLISEAMGAAAKSAVALAVH